MTGQEECVEALLQRGANVCVRDIRGRSPLHLASACGRVGALGALLQANTTSSHTNTHLTDNQGYTPLHWACYNGTGTHLTKTLVLNEAATTEPFSMFFPLYFSLLGYDACVEVLLDHDVFKNIKGNSFSPLHCAV